MVVEELRSVEGGTFFDYAKVDEEVDDAKAEMKADPEKRQFIVSFTRF